jgi:hypothetical protein
MKYISLNSLLKKYIEHSTIDFCTDDSAYGFVLGLTTHNNRKIIIKLNLNYFSPYGKAGEPKIRSGSRKRGTKKNQNIEDLRREVSNQIEFTKFSTAIPPIRDSAILQREDAIKFSNALEELQGNCEELQYWTAHLISQLNLLNEQQKYEFETKTGVIIMDSVGDLTLDDIVNEKYTDEQRQSLQKHTKSRYSIAETFKGKARALLLSLLWMGILHGDPHMENIRVDSSNGKLYLIDFGASIDFGSGARHLPKYLRKSTDAKKEFSSIKKRVNQWLPLTKNLTENGFTAQYKDVFDIKQPNIHISKKLLEDTIVKADPRQNGQLLTWNKMDNDKRWDLYHSGYKWIVDIDSNDDWKVMIQHAIINEPFPEIDVKASSRSSGFSLKVPENSNRSLNRFTRKNNLDSSRHSNRFTRKSRSSQSYFRNLLKSSSRPELIKLAKKTNTPIRKENSSYSRLKKNEIIDKLLDNSIDDLYTIQEELENSSHNTTQRETRSRTASTRKI